MGCELASKVRFMPDTVEIDRQEYEDIRVELTNYAEQPGMITGKHEDHGTVELARIDGRFFCTACETSFIRAKDTGSSPSHPASPEAVA